MNEHRENTIDLLRRISDGKETWSIEEVKDALAELEALTGPGHDVSEFYPEPCAEGKPEPTEFVSERNYVKSYLARAQYRITTKAIDEEADKFAEWLLEACDRLESQAKQLKVYCPRCKVPVDAAEVDRDRFHMCKCRVVPYWSELKRQIHRQKDSNTKLMGTIVNQERLLDEREKEIERLKDGE